MFDLIKQSLYLGMGFASLTRDKLMELGKEIASRAQLSQEQSKQFQEELMKKADQARQDLETEIDRRIDHAFIQLGIIKSGVTKVSEQGRHELEGFIDNRLNNLLDGLRVARTEDIDALKARIELLEKKLAEMQPS